ncbi:hypothetical protein [Parapedobacter sp. 2B3]|uniref:hypothetical protein n=1 Tax=Parapedobacter sp. 2B3 TaxID=3342381 RepID=UPI0035B5C85D
MKKTSLLYLAALATGLLMDGCKKDPVAAEDPGPVNKEYEWQDATIALPDGTNYSLSGHELNTVGTAVAVNANGATKVPKMVDAVTIHTVTNANGEPVLQGYSTPGKTEISPEATAKVTLFTLYRLAALPMEAQIAFLEGFESDHAADTYISEFAEAWKTEPNLLLSKKYTELIKRYHAAYHKSSETPVMAAKAKATDGRYYFVEGDTGELPNGYTLELEEPNKFHVLNRGPRTATAFIYKTRIKKNNTLAYQELIGEYGTGTKADKQWFVDNGRYLPKIHPLGYEVDYRQFLFGETVFEETKSGPHELPLADDEEVAEYDIRIVNAGIHVQEDELTGDEYAAYVKHMHAALIVDFYLPFIGINLGLDIDDFYAIEAEERVEKLDAAMRTAEIHALISDALKDGNLDGMLKTFERYFQSESTGYGIDLHEAVFSAVGRAVPGGLANAAKRNGLMSYYFDQELFWNTGQEERLFMDYYWETYGLISLKATARAGVVRISPRIGQVTSVPPNDTVRFRATIESEDFSDLDVTYRWRTAGGYGSIRVDSQSGADQLETDADNVVFKADYAPGRTAPVTQWIFVEVLKDDQLVGKDSAEITIGPSNYQIVPEGITLTGNSDRGPTVANLRIEPKTDNVPSLTGNPDLDIKIMWTTPGKHGGLRWNGQYATYWTTEVETINDATAQYRCSDEDTRESVETIEARIYGRPKGDLTRPYELIDVVRGSVNILNDPKKKIIWANMRLFHGDSSQPWSGGNTLYFCVKQDGVTFPQDPDAVSYSLRFLGMRTIIGAPDAHSWKAGDPSPYAPHPDTGVPGHTGTEYSVVYSYGTRNSYNGAHVDAYSNVAGGAEIIITLK